MPRSRIYKLKIHLPSGVDKKALRKEITNNIKHFTETYEKVDKKDISSEIKNLRRGADGSILVLLTITVLGTVLADVGEHLFRKYVLQPIMKKWKTEKGQNG